VPLLISTDGGVRNRHLCRSSLASDCASDQILHWNGIKWTQVTSSNPTGYNNLSGVAAKVGITWAVGSGGPPVETLAVHRLGPTWQQVPSPNASVGSLSGVAVTSDCCPPLWRCLARGTGIYC